MSKDFHSIDIRKDIPQGWTHIPRNVLAQDWHTDAIPYEAWADALMGFRRQEATGHITYGAAWQKPASWMPIFDGIVIKNEYISLVTQAARSSR